MHRSLFHDAYPRWFFLITKGLLAMALSSEFWQNQGPSWQMYPRILNHSKLHIIPSLFSSNRFRYPFLSLNQDLYSYLWKIFFFEVKDFSCMKWISFRFKNLVGVGISYIGQCNSWYLFTIKSWKESFLLLPVRDNSIIVANPFGVRQ